MHRVDQTSFEQGRGNALQACFATVFRISLTGVPNFIESKDYVFAIQQWLNPRSLLFFKWQPYTGIAPITESGSAKLTTPVLVAGKSPRGDHRHVVVGDWDGSAVRITHDPHPDRSGIDGDVAWMGFFLAATSLIHVG